MIDQTAAYIDATSKQFKVEKFYDDDIIGPVDFGLSEAKKDPESFCFGSGILAGSIIPGAKRLIFFGHSPLWQNYYISTMGGAAFVFHKTGLNYVCIKGCCDKHSILKINFKDGQLLVDFEDVDVESIWRDYQGLKGTYALQKYCYDEYHEEFTDYKSFRILATGPAAQKTRIGAIMSAPIEKGGPNHVDCWAGRGGLGSKLVQEHKIVAVVYGGNFVNPDEFADDKGEIQELFMDEFNKSMVCTDIDVTKKYRFDPTYNSGGTFGVNYTKLKGWMFCFNYSSIYFSEEKRLDIHKRFVVDHYLKQFNEETIEKKQFKHCGEPCSVVCKKMNNGFKKDYEPYQTLGPNSGIFDQRAAEKLNHHADTMGFDAIQVGGLLSWILDILSKGLIKKEDFDISQDPKFDPDNFDIVADSMHNADLGVEILNRILFDDKCDVFRQGIRNAAKALDQRYNIDTINHAVFIAFGKDGCMVPNQYWTPGMFSPMPIMGKYFEYYGSDFLPPYELGKKNTERMTKELYMDNTGMCRFHRGWAEKLIESLVNDLFEEEIDFYSHHRKLVQQINWGNKPVFWESNRVVDIIKGFLEKNLSGDPDNKELKDWIDRFNTDKPKAAKEFWEQILKGINDSLT